MSLKMKALGVALMFLLSGCSEQTQQKVQEAGQAVAEDAKQNAQQAMEVTADAANDAQVTTSVKSALVASDKMDTKALNVDTQGKTVFLRGAVPTEEMKTTAEEIAKNTVAEGYSVTNELVVGPPEAADKEDAAARGTPLPGDTSSPAAAASASPPAAPAVETTPQTTATP